MKPMRGGSLNFQNSRTPILADAGVNPAPRSTVIAAIAAGLRDCPDLVAHAAVARTAAMMLAVIAAAAIAGNILGGP